MTATEIITSLLIFLGVFLTFLSAVGVMRFPDVYSRMHAAGKSSTLGVVFLMLAVVVYFIPNGGINIKILLAIVFVFITAPLSSLMITRSAYRIGVRLEKNHVQDDLKKVKTKENNK